MKNVADSTLRVQLIAQVDWSGRSDWGPMRGLQCVVSRGLLGILLFAVHQDLGEASPGHYFVPIYGSSFHMNQNQKRCSLVTCLFA